jgi:sugar lactone lactonase YvrE
MNSKQLIITLFYLVATCSMSMADELKFAGILANSGEAGDTLIHFSAQEGRTGTNVVVDRNGRLWSRAGRGILNCYETDGRLVASYATDRNVTHMDRLAATDRLIVMLIRGVVWTLPVNASSNIKPTRLLKDIAAMASDARDNKVLVQLADNSVQWLDPTNGKLDPVQLEPAPTKQAELIVAPDGQIYLDYNRQVHRYVIGKEIIDNGWPHESTAERLQCFGDQWFGHTWHGTIKRFDADLNPDPGVILGGGSGSFIGFLPENPEIINGRGMVKLDTNVYAIGGIEGVIHLLYYDASQQRMQLIRRIGSLVDCPTLAINEQGVIWAAGGTWPWDGLPDTPMPEGDRAGEPTSQMVIMPNGYAVCYSQRYGKPGMAYGPYLENGMSRVSVTSIDAKKLTAPLAKDYPAAAVMKIGNRQCMFLVSDQGEGRLFRISDRGEFYQDLGVTQIQYTTPVKQVTTLAKVDEQTVLLAADGAVLTLTLEGNVFKETHRMQQWGSNAADHFGDRVSIACDANRLWVSDTTRHRVLVFDLNSRKPLATWGKCDKAGDDVDALDMPGMIAVNGQRGVLFDAQNQRLVRLEFNSSP